jgi:hypothetical protein
MSTCFFPSLTEGLALDTSVRNAFLDSLVWCQEVMDESFGTRYDVELDPGTLDLTALRPTQFGFYYSLSTDLSSLDQISIEKQAQQLYDFWQGALGKNSKPWDKFATFHPVNQSRAIAITQLNEFFYTLSEISCLNKWLDMEPDNAIELSGLETDEFLRAQSDLLKALNFIQKYLPDFYDEMQATTREIILAKPSGQQKMIFGGVSSFALWGALCLNIETHQDWRKYIPSLIHEYSHNVLFAKAMHSPLVNNDPEARYFSPLRGVMRPMDGIFHAAFVSARETLAAREALRQISFEGEDDLEVFFKQVELLSRETFEDCLCTIELNAELSKLGIEIIQNILVAMRGDQVGSL